MRLNQHYHIVISTIYLVSPTHVDYSHLCMGLCVSPSTGMEGLHVREGIRVHC